MHTNSSHKHYQYHEIKQVTTYQTNCIIFFPKCFEIPSFCMYIRVQAIENSSTQFFIYALFAETFGICAHHHGEETCIP